MFLSKRKWSATLALTFSFLGVSFGLLIGQTEPPKEQTTPLLIKDVERTDLQGDPLPPGALARFGTVRFRHGAAVAAVAFSPDGKTLETSASQDVSRLGCGRSPLARNSVATRHSKSGPSGRVLRRMARSLASAGWDNTVRLWDVSTGKELRQFTGHQGTIHAVAFSPDGQTLASASLDRTVRLWEASTGKEIRQYRGHQSPVRAVAFALDGKTLASASWDYTVRLWEASTGKEIRQYAGDQTGINAVAFSPDGKTLASAGYDKTVRLWEVSSGKDIRWFTGHQNGVNAVAFSADGKTLASAGDEHTVRLWELSSGKEIHQDAGHQNRVTGVAFAPGWQRPWPRRVGTVRFGCGKLPLASNSSSSRGTKTRSMRSRSPRTARPWPRRVLTIWFGCVKPPPASSSVGTRGTKARYQGGRFFAGRPDPGLGEL